MENATESYIEDFKKDKKRFIDLLENANFFKKLDLDDKLKYFCKYLLPKELEIFRQQITETKNLSNDSELTVTKEQSENFKKFVDQISNQHFLDEKKDTLKKIEYRANLEVNKQKFINLVKDNEYFKDLCFNKQLNIFIEHFLPDYKEDKRKENLDKALQTLRGNDLTTEEKHSEFFEEFVNKVQAKIETEKCFNDKDKLKKIEADITKKKEENYKKMLLDNLKDKKNGEYSLFKEFNIKEIKNLMLYPQFLETLKEYLSNIKEANDYKGRIETIKGLMNDENNYTKLHTICHILATIARDNEATKKEQNEATKKEQKKFETESLFYEKIFTLVKNYCNIDKLPYVKKEAFLNGTCCTDLGMMQYDNDTGNFIFYKNETEKDKNYYDNLKKMADLQRDYYKVEDINKKKEINEKFSKLSKITINNYEKEGKVK